MDKVLFFVLRFFFPMYIFMMVIKKWSNQNKNDHIKII